MTGTLTRPVEVGARPPDPTDQPPTEGIRPLRRLGLRKAVPFSRMTGVVLLLVVWAIGSGAGWIDDRKLSAPWTVVTSAVELVAEGTLQQHILASLSRAVLGFVIGCVIGTALALASGLTRTGEALIDGPVQFKRAIPTLGLIPLLILWLGIGETFKITVIALGTVVTIYIQTHNALTALEQRYVELAEVLALTRAQFVWKVVLREALPGFFLGLRLAVTGAWLTLIVVESINAVSGLGKMMFNAQNYGQPDVILVGLLVYGIFGLASDAGLRLVERRALAGLDYDVEIRGSALAVPEKVSVAFQDSRLLPWLRVLDNVTLGLDRQGRSRGSEMLAEVGLAGREDAWPLELSGGEQQRVALARALVREPQLLLADEPFGALDALTRIRMHGLLDDLVRAHRPTVLLVTHDVDEAIVLADRIVVLDEGRLAVDCHVDLDKPRSITDPGFRDIREDLLTALGVITQL